MTVAAAHPWRFLAWVQLLSVPFYWGARWPVAGFPFFGWPAAVAVIVVPAAVATALTAGNQGYRGAIRLWSRVGDIGRIRDVRWVLFALLFPAAVTLLSYAIVRCFHLPLPAVVTFTPAAAPGLFAAFLVAAIPEEIGWTGYATEPLQKRYGVLVAGLIIGAAWAIWHIALWWLGDGWEGQDRVLAVAAQAASTVAMRVVMGWLYANGGRSLPLAAIFHASYNTCWKLFPNDGSHFNPLATALVLIAMLVLVVAYLGVRHERFQRTTQGPPGNGRV